uniref:Zonadhesin n=1 Tax=Drosophila rhopaloa TaxID=1041015 RepID=A0A6P4FLF2_DRORH
MRSAKMAQSKSRHYVSLFVSMVLFVGSLNAECCTDGETKVDADDCSKYLACCHGEFVSKSCKDGYYWNSEKGDCVVDNGECKPPTCVEGSITANPDDCAGFLECVDGTVVVVSCPEGDYFNATQNSCVPDTCGVCINCTEGSKKEDLSDCAKFQICVNGKYVSQSCPTGDYWNSADKECQKDEGQCNGSPGCTEGELEVDPTDCAGYWKCTNGSLVSVKCPDGAYFNATYKTCVPDTDGVCVNCVEGAQKPEPTDCTKYQVCSGGKYVTKSCESGYYWNNKTEVCEWDNGQCNGNGTTCTDGEVKVDPTDCAGYLSCSNGKFVNVKCADGAYFNTTLETCVPDTDGVCVNCTEGAQKPEPTDCTKYQVCSGGKYVTKSCESGYYWNNKTEVCEWDNGQCNGNGTTCTDGDVKVDPTDCAGYLSCSNGSYVNVKCVEGAYFNTTLETCVPDTEGVCVKCTEGAQKPEPSDCTKYQVCSGGQYVTKSCESGYYWNNKTEVCEWDNGQCNGNGTTCTDGDVKVDPTDCAGYLSCSNGSYVNVKCAEGAYFNTTLETCVPDTEGVCVKCTEGAIKENPADCSGYLQCVNGNYVARKCSATQFFNATLQRCVVDTEGVCIPKTCDPDCCDVPNNSIWPVEKNCSAFYQCVDGNKYQQRCSNNLQYNSETEQCDYPENVNCDDGSAPPSGPNAGPSGTYCESHGRCVGQRDGTMFADASGTCSSAYVVCQCECEVNFSCSSGLMFNKQVDSCDWPANVKC